MRVWEEYCLLKRTLRVGHIKKVMAEQNLKKAREGVLQISGRTFQAEEKGYAKALGEGRA